MTDRDPTTPIPASVTPEAAVPQGPTSPPPEPTAGLPSRHADDTASTGGGASKGQEIAGHARSEMEESAEHATERARDVADTAKAEVRDVVDEARDALRRQADEQSRAAAGAISKLRDDLQAMSSGDAPRDATSDYLQRAAGSLDGIVDRLDSEGIEGALSGIRSFARRSPGTFLLASAGAGFAMGRLIRNADHPQDVDEEQSHDSDGELDLTDDAMGAGERSGQEAYAGGEMRR